MNTIVFSNLPDNTLQFDKNTSIVITENEKLIPTLDYLRDGKFTQFVSEVQNPQTFDLKQLAQILRVLAPQGRFISNFREVSESTYTKLVQLLKAVGFQQEQQTATTQVSNSISFVKKQWGASASVSIKKPEQKVQQQVQKTQIQEEEKAPVTGEHNFDKVTQVLPEKKPVQANPFDQFNTQDAENVDENDLLKNDKVEIKAPAVDAKGVACAPKGCKNCTCGKKERAEKGDTEELQKKLESGDIKSSCGNCFLGDAFRCASCPYKGLPAFKPGEKVQLDLQSDSAFNNGDESGEIKVSGGKVKLQI